MTEFKIMAKQITQIVDDYNLNRFKSHVLKDSDADEKFALKVEYALSLLKKEEKRIFENDFLDNQPQKYWWRNYYSIGLNIKRWKPFYIVLRVEKC